ncbi:acyltransferase family protein [Paenibacillus apiarius]|uniref:Fucose 4-O-acetylase n=1 Tax=Paenibacillus apiarius TaxID=46240 RepID=A0ABT4DXI2_9BACL|nr:fucose 4-O-acetylase [Paenibacillus apiarius]MBN3525758.1 fucose 4-O-acetylase [Paenibacillus apiarius]MCY9512881.1 fucose 4-O-acetylase [Paenibacillus apiarius]MCY9522070.1 fucose 4-O-acetylase [Paenibacillus apiarius]MCY9554111.1 fucose 4-O-acetylase [Paenibacillus apiarius]MCY9558830.1 fucose 4-O-acetylase [Paenibacillus apiarius]
MRERWLTRTAPEKALATLHGSGETFALNLRFLLIVCVFVGNAIEPLIGGMPEIKALFLWIYAFHMPLFVFVTGYFARHNLNGQAGIRVLKQIALQYVIFQSIYSLLDVLLFRVPGITHSFFMPYLLLWFLVGHMFWRLMMMLFTRCQVRHPIILSIMLGVLVGFLPVEGAWLGISRSVVYLPFFVIGYAFNFDAFRARITPALRLLAAALSAAILVALYMTANRINPVWLMNNMTFRELGWTGGFLTASVLRLGIYGLELVASIAFLAWVPQRNNGITALGQRTLYVFLIHGIVIRFVVYSGIYNHISAGFETALLIAASVAGAIMLAQPQVRECCHPIIEPKWDKIAAWTRRSVLHRGMTRMSRQAQRK